MSELGPLIPDDSTRGARVWRRTRGVAAIVLAFIAVTVLSPVLLLCGALVDGRSGCAGASTGWPCASS